jgi:hypothetical protein
MRFLIASGASIDHQDRKGRTPLIALAVKAQDMADPLPALQVLLDAGANVNARNKTGGTALINAAQACDPDREPDMVRALHGPGQAQLQYHVCQDGHSFTGHASHDGCACEEAP